MLSGFAAGLLFAYSGMLGLCLGLERHYRQVWQKAPPPWLPRALRAAGWLALVLAFYACVTAWGAAMGPVGWFGMISLTGFALVLLLPFAPRLAVWLPAGGGLLWGVLLGAGL
ncbi:hypothetical protein AvCA_36960 [Azotobacter vinelandii CA]|uniref:Iron uptake protein n=3 Tax=Azotobacter group TaxID=351 RepID=C1DRW7_AZOVD|nr:DUF3325 domain-containing protein [Azotobacter vinelandii]ACO79842.1 conserved hypothetical protein [Azotobacter vinelandii DJ]AGK16199.1 hypothetical protein AvCA_36960 [Azotobacter vinelandii CA]AGK21543.1 hypothetical protein AvCA6_36960 [Azotobacter vinelandii CA6]WKN20647.1 DUF3325 domain-containing protein [Azotobacter vinelandii]SFX43580.1 Protein of unknown function [Azotobacter vinelandii]